MSDIFKERERAFEAYFFDKESERLLKTMRLKAQREEMAEQLSRTCGVEDRALLERLLDQDVRADNLTALVLVPLVLVAWADREVSASEREAILDGAHEFGIAKESPAAELLGRWLEDRPGEELIRVWRDYVRSIGEALRPEDREGFADFVMSQADGVARASGGVLGFGPKVSKAEREVLDLLREAFAS